jgi:hypothetical protein
VGGTIGGLAAVALLIVLFVLMKKRRRKTPVSVLDDHVWTAEADGLATHELAAKERAREADGAPISEMAAKERSAAELL